MRLPHVVCSSSFPYGINAEHDNRGFIPLGSVCVSVDETAIGDGGLSVLGDIDADAIVKSSTNLQNSVSLNSRMLAYAAIAQGTLYACIRY
jgi:hypothetical protein